jgi:hypothetical protein
VLFPALPLDTVHIAGLLLATKTWQRPHIVNFWVRVETARLINMLFRKEGKHPQEDEIAPPAIMDGKAPTCTDPASQESTITDESKAKDLRHADTDIVYPSGLKLALLMTSIFTGMFLVSLVR